jgi:DNA-binding transcriptional regulator YdaS (Cro superfamily)
MEHSHVAASLLKAKNMLGSYEAIGRVCGVSGKAVMKWVRKARLPRTDYTGETQYAELIEKATVSAVTIDDLRPSHLLCAHGDEHSSTPNDPTISEASLYSQGHAE